MLFQRKHGGTSQIASKSFLELLALLFLYQVCELKVLHFDSRRTTRALARTVRHQERTLRALSDAIAHEGVSDEPKSVYFIATWTNLILE